MTKAEHRLYVLDTLLIAALLPIALLSEWWFAGHNIVFWRFVWQRIVWVWINL